MFAACTPHTTPPREQAPVEASAVVATWPNVPGVVIAHSPASSKAFIGSPSLAILPNGTYVASHDLFGPGSAWRTTNVFSSADRGKTWTPAATLDGQLWSTLFVHDGALYVIGTASHYGHVVIRRSRDGGKTWTEPSVLRGDGKFHCAPVPVVEHAGRVWRAMEQQSDPVRWPEGFRAFMMSAPLDADLLDPKSWTSTEPRAGDASWLDGDFRGWLEGNAVVAPDGHMVDILRVDGLGPETSAIVHVSDDGKTSTFDPKKDFAPFPGGETKFTIRFDPKTKLYFALSNYVPPELGHPNPAATRNTLALVSSPDLATWTVRTVLLHHPDRHKHGFHYVDWQFDGDDLVAVSRTAFDDGEGGADTYHNANFLTFHRIARFRELGPKDSVAIGAQPPVTYDGADFSLEATNVELATLESDGDAFSNRGYVWEGVPAKFAGWSYTRTAGGEHARVTITAKRHATIYVLTHGDALAGFGPVPGATFSYDDRKHTGVAIFQRTVEAGEKLDVAQSGWTGTMVLLPK